MTDQGYGQGQPEDAGRAAYGAPGQPQYGPGQTAGYPAQGAGYSTGTPQTSDSKGFLGALFDFGFTSFVTPKQERFPGFRTLVLAGLGALGLAATAFSVNTGLGILALIIFAPLYFLVVVAIWRISLEFFIVIFRVAEDMRAIRERGGMR